MQKILKWCLCDSSLEDTLQKLLNDNITIQQVIETKFDENKISSAIIIYNDTIINNDTNSKYFKKGYDIVEYIMNYDDININDILRKSCADIDDNDIIKFYRHMNVLFMNVLLNRLTEFGENDEYKATEAIRIIKNILL